MTFSVSGRRAPAAPTARDDESLPDSKLGGVHYDEVRWRAVQVSPGHLVRALNQAERCVARQAQQSANALPARGLLIRPAGMVVADEDVLVFLEAGLLTMTGLAVVCL